MHKRKLHIVSFDIPFPANYGGVIDVFWKLKWLHEQGVDIYLHCFEYGRARAPELEIYCEKIYYYKRKTSMINFFSFLPYTVKSRVSAEMEKNILAVEAPILCEVLHTCYLLNNPQFKNRMKIYRHSNIEHRYYHLLAAAEKNIFRKIYLHSEAVKLSFFEKIVSKANLVMAVNQEDAAYYQRKFPQVKTVYIPSFHPCSDVDIKQGRGEYVLFHGNLSVPENINAAVWLINKVFSFLSIPVVIAGLNPSRSIRLLVQKFEHIKLVENPSDEEMKKIIRDAQVHVLYTQQATGLKLKLLNVLFEGRYVVCNKEMLHGIDFDAGNSSISVCNSSDAYIKEIKTLFGLKFNEALIEKRKQLVKIFDNKQNAIKLLNEIYKTT